MTRIGPGAQRHYAKIFAMAQEITDANFEAEVLQSSIPVLVDFWAPWCGPCRAISPVIDELATNYDGKFKIVKLNTDDNPQSAVNYRINSIPNMIFFKDGKPVDQLIGGVDKAKIEEAIAKHS